MSEVGFPLTGPAPADTHSPRFRDYVKGNWRSLRDGRGDSALRRFYHRMNLRYRGRGGRIKKRAAAALWLLSIDAQLKPDYFFEDACSDRQEARLRAAAAYVPAYEAELAPIYETGRKLDFLEKRAEGIRDLQCYLSAVDIDPGLSLREIDAQLDGLKATDRLVSRIVAALREQPRMTQRELCRKLNVPAEHLHVVLDLLEFERRITWDRAGRVIRLAENPPARYA